MPNPIGNGISHLNYYLTTTSEVKLEVIHVSGQIVYSINLGTQEAGNTTTDVDFSVLKPGTYIARLTTNDGKKVTKLIKQ
jgi:hypothetical protein